mmetsp:Transcript_31900/g.58268  ORF Transcript_31900/g.58268 Transcript_31900/m.58268 type:complete len:217 (-) Transcript_31900:265-915(-)
MAPHPLVGRLHVLFVDAQFVSGQEGDAGLGRRSKKHGRQRGSPFLLWSCFLRLLLGRGLDECTDGEQDDELEVNEEDELLDGADLFRDEEDVADQSNHRHGASGLSLGRAKVAGTRSMVDDWTSGWRRHFAIFRGRVVVPDHGRLDYAVHLDPRLLRTRSPRLAEPNLERVQKRLPDHVVVGGQHAVANVLLAELGEDRHQFVEVGEACDRDAHGL